VFHVSMLELATPNTFQQYSKPPPASVIIDGEPEYEISKIVDSKIDRRRTCKLLYKVYMARIQRYQQQLQMVTSDGTGTRQRVTE